ncbi:DUF6850 family outer membrane beta-barrel protein [Gemmatimonas sp.]|uniref:DUF6850 family outer membrane beta-barrel protein n=1 Tax=Gemmatimonas sp. TaxID=1962908 RepID=UPI0025C2333F|nr:DUF6850 family outer membrane beta-barrel protein [Gemmatimonas sp.]MCA2985975.1 hypothetical protein [Gemmatimonas sp.]MCA2996508.1 hypothetical protein [Gemmatimonas sp.]
MSGRVYTATAHRLAAVALATMGVTVRVNAQSLAATAHSPLTACCAAPGSRGSIVLDTAPGLLRDGGMAAALADLPRAWRRYAVSAHTMSGDWRRTHDAGVHEEVILDGQGGRAVGRWYLSGGARLHRQRERDVQWRNQSAASLGSGYVWADSIGGTFRGDAVALQAAFASPEWRGFSVGAPLELALGQGARRNDPRPLVRRRVMEVGPAVRWRRGAHELGVVGRVGSQREDLEIGGGLSPDVPVVFRLRGIATFDRTQLNSAERTLLGSTRSLGAAWSRRAERTWWVMGSHARVEEDRVRDGIATPVGAGETRRVRVEVYGAWRRQQATGGTELRSAWRQESARGTDPVFRAVNAIREGRRGEATLSWWSGADVVAARWHFDAHGAMHSLLARDVAGEASWQVTRWPLAAGVSHVRTSRAGRAWFAAARAGHTVVTGASVRSVRPSAISPRFVTHDHAVHAAPASTVRASLGVERTLGATGSRARWSVAWESSHARVTLPVDPRWARRQALSLSMELM